MGRMRPDDPDNGKKRDNKGILKRLGKYVLKYWYLFIPAIVLTLLSNQLSLLGPLYSGEAIDAITAKSGVGKSTHTALWLKNIPNARVLNGDKPLYRLEEDGSLTAFGTPWNGKENWGENISAPLAAICFIERGVENSIRRANEEDTVSRLMHQLYLRGSRDSVTKQLILMDALVRGVPYYVLACNISDEAALLAWNTMRKS